MSAPSPRPRMSERDWQALVISTAQTFGWRVAHFRKVRVQRRDGSTYWETPVAADGAGFFDLVLIHRRRGDVIFAELKARRGRVEPEQVKWQEAGRHAMDVNARTLVTVFRPNDWSRVLAILRDGLA